LYTFTLKYNNEILSMDVLHIDQREREIETEEEEEGQGEGEEGKRERERKEGRKE
jgi:hypothetical protein